jgi:hypothetical protein
LSRNNTELGSSFLMYDVAIVGYGPVGATLAGLLGQLDLNVAVFEKSKDIVRPRISAVQVPLSKDSSNREIWSLFSSVSESGMLIKSETFSNLHGWQYPIFRGKAFLGGDGMLLAARVFTSQGTFGYSKSYAVLGGHRNVEISQEIARSRGAVYPYAFTLSTKLKHLPRWISLRFIFGRIASTVDAGIADIAGIADDAGFRGEGDTRVVRLGGVTAVVRDLKGLRYIERLLAEPGREFHVLDMVAVEAGWLPTHVAANDGLDDDGRLAARGVPVLDERAREAYRRRLAEVDDDIEEATAMNDIARRELAERDREYLIAELRSAVGLGGAHRSTGGSAERARTAVTRSMRYALARLAEHHPLAAAHLDQRVRTGIYCSYVPDELAPIRWR